MSERLSDQGTPYPDPDSNGSFVGGLIFLAAVIAIGLAVMYGDCKKEPKGWSYTPKKRSEAEQLMDENSHLRNRVNDLESDLRRCKSDVDDCESRCD